MMKSSDGAVKITDLELHWDPAISQADGIDNAPFVEHSLRSLNDYFDFLSEFELIGAFDSDVSPIPSVKFSLF